MSIIVYLSLGAVVGLVSSMLGLGGGVIIVPILSFTFSKLGLISPVHTAIGTSLAIMIVTSCSSARVYYHQHSIRFDIWRRWVWGIALGAIAGAYCAHMLSAFYLRLIYSVFLLVIVIKMWFGSKLSGFNIRVSRWFLLPLGVLIGAFSGMLGIGGGVLMVPLLLSMGCKMNDAVGTATASSVPLAVVGSLAYMFLGGSHLGTNALAIGYVYWPAFIAVSLSGAVFAQLGGVWAHKVPASVLKHCFVALTLAITLLMILRLIYDGCRLC